MLIRLLILLISFVIASAVFAGEPSRAPILRIETGRHTSLIEGIATDANGRWLMTASHDKTLRIWEFPAGRLVRTIRPPIDTGYEGYLYKVAISPDGSTIACGGWTGWGWDGSAYVYIFNRASGNLTGRLSGLTNIPRDIQFSPDGRFLVVALGETGIRLYRTSDWTLVAEDRDYGNTSFSAHFSGDGRLVTASFDGFVRLYDVSYGSLNQIAKVKAPGGSKPHSVRFSPDGNRIAVSYPDSTTISVLSGRDLSHLYSPDISGVSDGNLISLAWSGDGRYLFAGGTYQKQYGGVWKRAILRWPDGGKGKYSDYPAAGSTIMGLSYLSDGTLAFGSGEPAFGLLDQSGKRILYVPPSIADFRNSWDVFSTTGDGSLISFGFELWGQSPASFDLVTRNLTPGRATATLPPPRTAAAGLAIDGWDDTYTPTLNGVPLKLWENEKSRSLAIAQDDQSFILGSDWNLRRFDRQGNQLWEVPSPGTVWAVNVTGNGSVVIAAYGDGTIRWHRVSDGKELLAFFPHSDRKRWVLWSPSGYYDASPGGEELIGWHVNNGKDHAADFFPASKFRTTYYRPDVLAKVLDTLDETEALRLANADSGKKQAIASVATLLPPVVSILSPQDKAQTTSTSITIRYAVRTPGNAPATAVRVLVDGRPVSIDRGLKAVPKNAGEQSVTVKIPEHDCEVSIIAENRHASSEPATIRLAWAGKRSPQEEFQIQPKLYILAIGVSAYHDKSLTLRFAAKDARDFAAAMARQKGGLYRDVVVKTLTDASATKDDVMDGLDWLQKEVTAKDVGIIFVAGHGVNDSTGIYYYLPQNANTDKLKRTGVAFSDIKNTLAALSGKAVLFVDTCHSGNIMGARRGVADINAVVNELASAENGAVVFASSSGRQYSLENDAWGNGAFTKALVEGISGKADYTGKGRITVNMLDLYLSERVKELTRGQQTPTTTKPQTIQDFPIAVKR